MPLGHKLAVPRAAVLALSLRKCLVQAFDPFTGKPYRAVEMVSWPRATRLRRAVPKVLAGLVIESFVPTKAAATVRNIFDRCGVLYPVSGEAARKVQKLGAVCCLSVSGGAARKVHKLDAACCLSVSGEAARKYTSLWATWLCRLPTLCRCQAGSARGSGCSASVCQCTVRRALGLSGAL